MKKRIAKRIVDTKRHTKAYVIDGKRITRGSAVKMARRGHLEDVTAKKGPHGWFVASLPSAEANLYDLPIVVE